MSFSYALVVSPGESGIGWGLTVYNGGFSEVALFYNVVRRATTRRGRDEDPRAPTSVIVLFVLVGLAAAVADAEVFHY